MKPKELEVVTVPLKTSPVAQEPLQFQVEVVSDEVHHKLNSSVELNVGFGNSYLFKMTVYKLNVEINSIKNDIKCLL